MPGSERIAIAATERGLCLVSGWPNNRSTADYVPGGENTPLGSAQALPSRMTSMVLQSSTPRGAIQIRVQGCSHSGKSVRATPRKGKAPGSWGDRGGLVGLATLGVKWLPELQPMFRGHAAVALPTIGLQFGSIGSGLVVTAGRASRNLRIWQPSSGKVCLVPLAFAPEWLTFTGTTLTAGIRSEERR